MEAKEVLVKEEEEDHGEVGGKHKTVCCGEELEKKVEEQIEEGTPSPSSKPGWKAALPPTLIDSPAVLCWVLGKKGVERRTRARPGSHGEPK